MLLYNNYIACIKHLFVSHYQRILIHDIHIFYKLKDMIPFMELLFVINQTHDNSCLCFRFAEHVELQLTVVLK